MAYEYDPRRRRRGRVPPQLRAWVFGRRRRTRARRYDPDPPRRRYPRRYDPVRRFRRPSLWGLVSKAVGVGAFVEQVTEKDRTWSAEKDKSATGWNQLSFGDKLKFIGNCMSQRILGVQFDKRWKYPRTLNPMGIFNKWLGIGIGLIIAGMIPGIPFRGKMKSFGRNIAVGGGLGGLFDQPALQTPEYHPELAKVPAPTPVPLAERRSVWS